MHIELWNYENKIYKIYNFSETRFTLCNMYTLHWTGYRVSWGETGIWLHLITLTPGLLFVKVYIHTQIGTRGERALCGDYTVATLFWYHSDFLYFFILSPFFLYQKEVSYGYAILCGLLNHKNIRIRAIL